jgi:hypothetical protein
MSDTPATHDEVASLSALIQELRNECNHGFSSVNRRLDAVEGKYHQAVETLPLMRGISQKLTTVLHHMEDGGEKARMLKEFMP